MKITHDELARRLGIEPDEQAVLDSGSSHPYTCRCEVCLNWWVMMGPEDLANPTYGPFTEAEIEAARFRGQREYDKQ